jgi:cyanophycinase
MPGMLMPIGGAEDRRASKNILNRFVQISGGSKARIAVIPSASRISAEVAKDYETIFYALGAWHVQTIDIIDRHQAADHSILQSLNGVTGIFFTGGDQMRLLSLIGNTIFSDAIVSHFRQGVHIAGTSAGASAMSQHMIGFGESGSLCSPHRVHIHSGLGLAHRLIIDQHFSQRNRLGRLMSAVALYPQMQGIGIDEDTSLLIRSNGDCEVIGSGSVTLVNTSELSNNRHPVKAYKSTDVEEFTVCKLQAGMQLVL